MNEGSGAYLKFRLKERALIGGFEWRLVKFPFQRSHVNFVSAKS